MVKRALPETLPELAASNAKDGAEDISGLQPIHEAWPDVLTHMQRAFSARDYARALDLGERFLAHDPAHVGARLFVQECRTIVETQLDRQLAPLDRVVALAQPLDELTNERIDPRTAFLLSRVDGRVTIEDLVDLAAMPRVDALRVLADAIARGLVTLD